MLERLQSQINNSSILRWYQGREPNERPIIAALAALVAVSLLWAGLWKPISDWQDLETNRYQNAQTTWDWVQANEGEARKAARSQNTGGRSAQRSLLPVITRAANGKQLTLNRLQPEADGGVSVVLQAQSFNTMMIWLQELEQQHNVVVHRVSLDAEGKPGLVNAQLRLQ